MMVVVSPDDVLAPPDPHDCDAWFADLPNVIAGLRTQIEQVRVDAANTETQVIAWLKICGTPRVQGPTMESYARQHLGYWQQRATELRKQADVLERDVNSLQIILDTHTPK